MSKQIRNNEKSKIRGIVDVLEDNNISTPPLLYKYYAFNNFTQRIFKNNEIYFSSPESFNDPFDSKIRLIYEGTRSDRKRFFREWSNRSYPDLPRKELLAREKRILKQGLDQGIKEYAHKQFMVHRGRMGVFSMTEDRENILMWSHYAAEHTGFCIGFRTNNTFFSRARRVEYDKVLPCVNLLEAMWDELITKGAFGLLTKALDWSYEKEWRIVNINGVGIHKYPCEALSSVILGCKMSPENSKRIKEWCNASKIRHTLYEAKEKEHEFGLDIISLS
jgi:hypothetical protein